MSRPGSIYFRGLNMGERIDEILDRIREDSKTERLTIKWILILVFVFLMVHLLLFLL